MSGAPDGLDGAIFFVLFFVGVFFVFFFFVLKTHRFLFIPSLVSQDGVGYGVAVTTSSGRGLCFCWISAY
jgi:hypothetical protein